MGVAGCHHKKWMKITLMNIKAFFSFKCLCSKQHCLRNCNTDIICSEYTYQDKNICSQYIKMNGSVHFSEVHFGNHCNGYMPSLFTYSTAFMYRQSPIFFIVDKKTLLVLYCKYNNFCHSYNTLSPFWSQTSLITTI